jgi:hypothetical protein
VQSHQLRWWYSGTPCRRPRRRLSVNDPPTALVVFRNTVPQASA